LESPRSIGYQALQSYNDLNDLEPSERRKIFMERIKKNYTEDNKEKLESLVWNFALTEPFVKFKYYYKSQNIFFFILIMGVMYGIFMFVIKMLIHREEQWNLI
jgi:hypothetical protein